MWAEAPVLCGLLDERRTVSSTGIGKPADPQKVRDQLGSHLTDIAVTYHVAFPEGEGGDAARELPPGAVRRSHDSLCTVSKTVELGTPVATTIA